LIDRQLIMVPQKTWFCTGTFKVTFTVTFDFLAAGLSTPPTYQARRSKRPTGGYQPNAAAMNRRW
jgi:hypothetical protein